MDEKKTKKRKRCNLESKTCTKCNEEKKLSDFPISNHSTGLRESICQKCLNSNGKKYREQQKLYIQSQTPEERAQFLKDKFPDGLKHCTRCDLDVPISKYYKNIGRPDGLRAYCGSCSSELARIRYKLMKEYIDSFKISGKCAICGFKNNPTLCLEFAHVSREAKARTKSGRRSIQPAQIRSKKSFDRELPKLRLLCLLCHDVETDRESSQQQASTTKIRNRTNKIRKRRDDIVNAEKRLRGTCSNCPVLVKDVPYRHMEFDHIDPSTKTANVSRMIADSKWSTEEVNAEMRKCRLLCRMCHRIKTVQAMKIRVKSTTSDKDCKSKTNEPTKLI